VTLLQFQLDTYGIKHDTGHWLWG